MSFIRKKIKIFFPGVQELISLHGEKVSPFYPSGIRLGTPALTSRGMKELDMVKVALFIKRVLEIVKDHPLPKEQELRKEFIKGIKVQCAANKELKKIKSEVEKFAKKFPMPGVTS